MKNETTQTLAAIVDRLGTLKAVAAQVADESEILKGELILAGVPAIDGGLFRATVSHCPGRDSVDVLKRDDTLERRMMATDLACAIAELKALEN